MTEVVLEEKKFRHMDGRGGILQVVSTGTSVLVRVSCALCKDSEDYVGPGNVPGNSAAQWLIDHECGK
jgi:hypothetical protein